MTEEERRAEEKDFIQGVVEIAEMVRSNPDEPSDFPRLSDYGNDLLDALRSRLVAEEFGTLTT